MQTAIHEERLGPLKSSDVLEDIDGTFQNRAHAARYLVGMGVLVREARPHLIAFAPGGREVAEEMARLSRAPLAFAEVAELAPPWLGGPIFGAVAFDGSVVVDEELKEVCAVSREDYLRLVQGAYERVASLLDQRRTETGFPDLKGRTAIVVDDGLSASFSTRAAIAAVRNAGATRVVLAFPVGHRRSVRRLSAAADLTFCASLRSARQELEAVYAPMQHFPCLAAPPRKADHMAGRAAT